MKKSKFPILIVIFILTWWISYQIYVDITYGAKLDKLEQDVTFLKNEKEAIKAPINTTKIVDTGSYKIGDTVIFIYPVGANSYRVVIQRFIPEQGKYWLTFIDDHTKSGYYPSYKEWYLPYSYKLNKK
jgi:hypothetical protein